MPLAGTDTPDYEADRVHAFTHHNSIDILCHSVCYGYVLTSEVRSASKPSVYYQYSLGTAANGFKDFWWSEPSIKQYASWRAFCQRSSERRATDELAALADFAVGHAKHGDAHAHAKSASASRPPNPMPLP
jgi:hypothetical protein